MDQRETILGIVGHPVSVDTAQLCQRAKEAVDNV